MVSVIITTKNSEKHIARCIESVQKSTHKVIEIIVVDNFSTDKTGTIAESMGAKVYLWGDERSAQRNYGVQKSAGGSVLFLDVDMTIHTKLIAECVGLCADNYCDLGLAEGFYSLYIPEKVVGRGWWASVRNYERGFYDGTFIDCPRFFRKEIWIPFDESLTGVEDWDWSRYLPGGRSKTKHPIFHHEGKFSFIGYLKKKRYYVQWMDRYKKKHPGCKELSMFYRYVGVFFEDGKWKRIIDQPVKFMGVLWLRVCVGIVYLFAKKY